MVQLGKVPPCDPDLTCQLAPEGASRCTANGLLQKNTIGCQRADQILFDSCTHGFT